MQRLEKCVIAKDIKDSNKKKAMFLHYAGEDMFDLSDCLRIVAGTTYDETNDILTEYFAHSAMWSLKYSCFARRRRRRNRFWTNLRQRTQIADYPEIPLGKVREKDMSEPNITLTELMKYGRALEATTIQGEAMTSTSVSNGGGKVHEVYAKHQTRQHNQARDVDGKVKHTKGHHCWHDHQANSGDGTSRFSRGCHFSKTFTAGSHTCTGCGGRRHTTIEKHCPV